MAMTNVNRLKRHAPLLVAISTPLVMFFLVPLLSRSGLWDPYELATADTARRIALNLFHGSALSLDAAHDTLPTLIEIGRPQLPATCVALGFRLFGLHDWAGRAPLALFGLLGVLATYATVARLVDRRAGIYAVIALATTPLYFVEARTMLGDIVTMSASAAAFGGLAASIFDRASARSRAPFLAMAVAGICVGFGSRGAILGVAVPCVGVSLAWLLGITNGGRRSNRFGDAVAIGSMAFGLAALAIGWRALAMTPAGEVTILGGVLVHAPSHLPPFDRIVAEIGHALLPWSALLPFALGRLFVTPPCDDDEAATRESHFRVVLLVGSSCALAAHTFLAAKADVVPFSAPALLAIACAIAVRDFERGASPSVAVAAGTLLVAAIFQHDLRVLPEKAFEPFGIAASTFPPDFQPHAAIYWAVAIAIFAAGVILTWVEKDDDRIPFDRSHYEAIARSLRTAWEGRVASLYVSCVAIAVSLSAVIFIGMRLHARFASSMPAQLRAPLLNAWWGVPLAPLVVIFGTTFALDLAAWLVARAPRFARSRASIVMAGGAAAGLVLCAGYYPALAAQLSPKSVFTKYERAHAKDEPLALLDVSDRGAAYYTGAATPALKDPAAAIAWLDAASHGRRFLAASHDDLARLNALHRASAHVNLPVLEASDRSILAASSLAPGEPSANPLDAILLASAPALRHPLETNLDDRVIVLGFELVDPRGAKVDAITTGRHTRLRTYYRVIGKVGTDYTLFVHIEAFGRRNNGDHAFPYPTSLWQIGDILVDDHEITLEPNFTPGLYQLYFGFYSGGSEGPRLQVKSGPADKDNRVHGGAVRVE